MKNDGRFSSGHIETVESKIKRMYALEESWKTRKAYIGDLTSKHPYIYNSWRGIRFTDKGKAAGNSEEWNDFRAFYNDVIVSYKDGLLFRRLDKTKVFSKNNFIWVTKEEAALLQSNLIWLEFEGKNLTLLQWAKEAGVSGGAVKNRYHRRHDKSYTVREIIYGRVKKRGSKTPKDYLSTNPRSKASKMISSYKAKDFKNGTTLCDITVDWMIDNIFKSKCTYCGDTSKVGCDRVDNSLGHTKDNVVPCCVSCNTARGDNFTLEEMKLIGKTIKKIKNARNKERQS